MDFWWAKKDHRRAFSCPSVIPSKSTPRWGPVNIPGSDYPVYKLDAAILIGQLVPRYLDLSTNVPSMEVPSLRAQIITYLALKVLSLTVVVTTSSSQEPSPATSDLASATARRADINRRSAHRAGRTSMRERKNHWKHRHRLEQSSYEPFSPTRTLHTLTPLQFAQARARPRVRDRRDVQGGDETTAVVPLYLL